MPLFVSAHVVTWSKNLKAYTNVTCSELVPLNVMLHVHVHILRVTKPLYCVNCYLRVTHPTIHAMIASQFPKHTCRTPLHISWGFIFLDHDDVIKGKHIPPHWPFVRGIHRSPVNSPHKCQWRGALMFYLICAWINGSVNNREAGDLRRHRAHYEVTVMYFLIMTYFKTVAFLECQSPFGGISIVGGHGSLFYKKYRILESPYSVSALMERDP